MLKSVQIVLALLLSVTVFASRPIVSTPAYEWRGDTVFQGEFFATAPSGQRIISTYSASPGYFMPVEKTWELRNDISQYPTLKTNNRLLEAVYNMGLDEMINNVEPDTTLRTGKEWAGVWTRDVSYSIILSMAAMQPEAARISLMRKVNSDGQIIQDTGSGGAWPISTDRMIWAVAAYELYKVTGDKDWLRYLYDVVKASLEKDALTVMSPNGLVQGETSFIDWREQSYPKWMQTADIYDSESLSTSVVHAAAMQVLAKAALELGHADVSQQWQQRADSLIKSINEHFWLEDKGHYGMYRYGRDYKIMNPRSETLGQSLAVLFDVATEEQAAELTRNSPVTKWGVPVFNPQIADMPSYHNNALWPFVAAYWTLANAKAGNEEGVLQGMGSIIRPAALFATNKENLTLDNGDITTELNSSNMLWSLAGNLALVQKLLFGINYETNGIRFAPFVPEALADTRTLSGLHYRDAVLNITVEGYGNEIAKFYINGKQHKQPFLSASSKGVQDIRIVMADNKPALSTVNLIDNAKSPLTPIVRWAFTPEHPFTVLEWSPIEYIASYDIIRDGQVIDNVRTTTYNADVPGEYMVVGVSEDGLRGFASEPLSNRPVTVIEMPRETDVMTSTEISYPATQHVQGMSGGFVEIDQTTDPVSVAFDAPTEGTYAVVIRYANGNGPVNTENKAAIRTLTVDGNPVATIVMPQRGVGNWNDWGESNHMPIILSEGKHIMSIEMLPQNRNMNLHTNHALIDNIKIYRLN
ncbi:MAG: hypothetical protein J1F20_06545 [Muribaculaceae bacterium]|nr:hypothetical protein [Muribaculaceae bacterium]